MSRFRWSIGLVTLAASIKPTNQYIIEADEIVSVPGFKRTDVPVSGCVRLVQIQADSTKLIQHCFVLFLCQPP